MDDALYVEATAAGKMHFTVAIADPTARNTEGSKPGQSGIYIAPSRTICRASNIPM
jgi:Exoribonuclease II